MKGMQFLVQSRVPISRPDDFLAEMLKSDGHMAQVKSRLLKQQVKIKTFEEKLDMIKREVQLEYLANKKSNGRSGTEMSMTMNDRTIQENPFFNMM